MIDGAGHMMKLDPKGLEAAREQPGTNHEAIIRAYIDAIMPVRVSGLVERLRGTHTCDGCGEYAGSQIADLTEEAADSIEALSASLASERAAHAETKRELDELKADIDSYAEASSNLATELYKTEARLAEAMKALVAIECRPEKMIWGEDSEVYAAMRDMEDTARRVREGGEANG